MTSQQTIGAAPTADSMQNAILKELRRSLKSQARNATFALGGSVPILIDQDTSMPSSPTCESSQFSDSAVRPSKPIHIRFGDSGLGANLILPTVSQSPELHHLVQACSPASFGRNGKDVLDPSYRKAGKLDVTDFATTFCPCETGIVDVLNQVLVTDPQLGTRAELYKLNVYSAPSGFFKAHVDTPRGETQYGSLVVSLPVDHEGGELLVRHGDKELTFDWSTSASKEAQPAVQWAAFYSDCEHEVLEVTSGHRITLTYNLYTTRAAGLLAGQESALDPKKLPLYASLGTALQCPDFLPGGRVLAIHLTHAYAHTSERGQLLPSSLKGADMAIYETARALNLSCYVRPVMGFKWEEHDDEDQHDEGCEGRYETRCTLLGDEFRELFMADDGGELSGDKEKMKAIRGAIGARQRWREEKVTWINPDGVGHKAAQSAIMAYGNQAELELKYSYACLLIRIPRFTERFGLVVKDSSKIFRGIDGEYSDTCEKCIMNSNKTYDEQSQTGESERKSPGPMDIVVPNNLGRSMTQLEVFRERQRLMYGEYL